MTLVDTIAGPDGDLLGLYRLMNGGLANDCGAARRDLLMKLQSPEYLRRHLEKLHGTGYRGVAVVGEPRLYEALGRHGSAQLPAPLPIVPNMQGFMREAVEHGMVGAGLRRAWRVGPLALMGLGLRRIADVPALARREFPAMLQVFIELELADFTRYDPPVVFLQAQMTDLALAMRNPHILEAFFKAARGRTGAAPGLVTYNFGALVAALKSWGMEAEAVITPWNAVGSQMHPDPAACAQAAKSCNFPIWAERLGRPDAPVEEERAAWRKAALAGAVRDDLALWLNP